MLHLRLPASISVAVALLACASARAATLTVNTYSDDSTAGDGVCSLRKAIEAVDSPGAATNSDCAPAAFGANTIVLPAGTFLLNGPVAPEELQVASTVTNLTIAGTGEQTTTISGGGGTNILGLAAGATVNLQNLTITDAQAPAGAVATAGTADAGGPGADGGAITNLGTLALDDVAVTDSRAGAGGAGAIASAPGVAGGAGGVGGSGGAILNQGTLTLTGVTLSDDSAGSGGAGAAGTSGVSGGQGGAGGDGGNGGAIFNKGSLTVTASTIRGSSSGAGGTAGAGGDGSTGTAGAGGNGGDGGDGGAIFSSSGALAMLNDTIASNTAASATAGADAGTGATGASGGNGGNGGGGGGLGVLSVPGVSITNLTVAGNAAGAAGAAGLSTLPAASPTAGVSGTGGGIESTGSHATLQNTLLASNAGGNCGVTGPAVTDLGHNLSFGDSSCPATFAGGDPMLGPLKDNGGPAETISLGSGSAAIDEVPATGANCPAADERGVSRPSGAACDIGAYEVAPPLLAGVTTTRVDTTHAVVTATVTPNAGAGTFVVNYGLSPKYGESAPSTQLDGVTAAPLAVILGRLKPLTKYHYDVVVTTMDGTVTSADGTFVTAAPVLRSLGLAPSKLAPGATATITYADSEAAQTTFAVQRCAALRRRSCRAWTSVFKFGHADVVGANTVRFAARRKGHALQAGSWRLEATPAQGKIAGRTVSIGFTIRG